MTMHVTYKSGAALALFVAALGAVANVADAITLGGNRDPQSGDYDTSPAGAPAGKDGTVAKFIEGCASKQAKEAKCDTVRKETVEIIKEDLHTLGSSTDRAYLPTILKIFKSDEPVLRIAAADAIGMIGPQDSDADVLAPLANDPVPDVRRAVGQMIQHAKGPALAVLAQRVVSLQTGLTPEKPPDPAKFMMPVAPESTYLYYASDVGLGRLSYVAKGMNESTAFFKAKAKKGPFKLEEFQEKYRYQLQDDEHARTQAGEDKFKQLEQVKPDPTNLQAFTEYMGKVQAVQGGQMATVLLDSYQPTLFGAPTVYVLEERQIGQRSYPTRYVVLYQDLALKRPGYRLSWMTVTDQAIKSAQATSITEQKQEEALQEKGKRSVPLVEKSEQERKKFKQGQSELEKQLGF